MSDLISSKRLIKRLEEWNTEDAFDKALYRFAMNRVIEQPIVEAKPVVRGKWIEVKENYWFDSACSICGELAEFKTNFCPNCGADMRGRKND